MVDGHEWPTDLPWAIMVQKRQEAVKTNCIIERFRLGENEQQWLAPVNGGDNGQKWSVEGQ